MEKPNGTTSSPGAPDGRGKIRWALADAFALAETIRRHEGIDVDPGEIYKTMLEYDQEEHTPSF